MYILFRAKITTALLLSIVSCSPHTTNAHDQYYHTYYYPASLQPNAPKKSLLVQALSATFIGSITGYINGWLDSTFLLDFSPLLCVLGSWQCEMFLREQLLEENGVKHQERFAHSLSRLCSWVAYLCCFKTPEKVVA